MLQGIFLKNQEQLLSPEYLSNEIVIVNKPAVNT